MNKFSLIKEKKETFLIGILFFFSIIFFILQHYFEIGWDFIVYVLDAKYLFGQGNFFEWTRPPLMPFLIGIFSFFSFWNWKLAEYAYIIFVSIIFLFASIKFANRFKLNRIIFYVIFLSPFLLLKGVIEGTELLSLALIMLFIAYLGKKQAPIFLALAVLTRYPNLIFGIFLFLNLENKYFLEKNIKKIILNLIIFTLCLSPWFIYNLIYTGNAFTSFMDSYALTTKFRSYIHQPFNFKDLLLVSNYLLPLSIVGLYFFVKRIVRKKTLETFDRNAILMLFIAILVIVSYIRIPLKVARYLFLLLLPLNYFSCITIYKIKDKIRIYFIVFIVIFSFIISFYILFNKIQYPAFDLNNYKNAINETEDYIGNCALASNGHIFLNYIGIESEGFPDGRVLHKRIDEGYRILLFKYIPEPDYTFNNSFLQKFPIIKQTNDYILLGNVKKCKKEMLLDITYLQKIDRFYRDTYNESFNITLYELVFTDKSA